MRYWFVMFLFLVSIPSLALAQPPVNPSQVLGRMLTVKPKPDDLEWKQIPWLQNLQAARKAAQSERRPLLLWGSDDEPLQRC